MMIRYRFGCFFNVDITSAGPTGFFMGSRAGVPLTQYVVSRARHGAWGMAGSGYMLIEWMTSQGASK